MSLAFHFLRSKPFSANPTKLAAGTTAVSSLVRAQNLQRASGAVYLRQFSSPASSSSSPPASVDVVVIGAGQAGLSVAYHLQRLGGVRYVVLDSNDAPGGAWRHRWPSLELFSTRKWSSLPGHPMFTNKKEADEYPTTQEMTWYLEEYEHIMDLNIVRPVSVKGVTRMPSPPASTSGFKGTLMVDTESIDGTSGVNRWECKAVVSATGTHSSPYWPCLPGHETFKGLQIHSSQYRYPDQFRGKRVMVVGCGNSAAQILAEVSAPGMAASTLWVTDRTPSFLPEDMSGKDIFELVGRIRREKGFIDPKDIPSLDSIISQPKVREAGERGVYDNPLPPITGMTDKGVSWDMDCGIVSGSEGSAEAEVDAVIWCTGFRASTDHLKSLGVVNGDSTIVVRTGDVGGVVGGGESVTEAGLFAVGYGHWAGVGSGSVPGAAMYAGQTAKAVVRHLQQYNTQSNTSPALEEGVSLGSDRWEGTGIITTEMESEVQDMWRRDGEGRGLSVGSVVVTGSRGQQLEEHDWRTIPRQVQRA